MKLIVVNKSSEVFAPHMNEIAYQVTFHVLHNDGKKVTGGQCHIFPKNVKEFDFFELGKEFQISELQHI